MVDIREFRQGNLLIAEEPTPARELHNALDSLQGALDRHNKRGSGLLLSDRLEYFYPNWNMHHATVTPIEPPARASSTRRRRRRGGAQENASANSARTPRGKSHGKHGKRLYLGSSEDVISRIRQDTHWLSNIDHCIIDGTVSDNQQILNSHLQFIYSKFRQPPPTILILDDANAVPDFEKLTSYFRNQRYINLKEHVSMKNTRKQQSVAKDKRKAQALKTLVNNMVHDTDPHVLNEYRSLIRGNVSIFHRAYLAGYLYRLLEDGGKLSQRRERSESSGRGRTRTSEARNNQRPTRNGADRDRDRDRGRRSGGGSSRASESVAPVIVDGIACLYMNVGKIHGLNEDNVKELLSDIAQFDKDVEQLKIFDLYTFVYIDAKLADTVINALNGKTNFNRKMVVSYSKKGNKLRSADR